MYKVKLEKFEGPLDLLLQLIESADLDITEISLSQVADQFMRYLIEVENKNPDELADFLVAASRLLLIKSRILLPNLHIEDEGEAMELEIQLKIYKEYYEANLAILEKAETLDEKGIEKVIQDIGYEERKKALRKESRVF